MTLPPPALDCAHVIEYAIVDPSVRFEQRYTLNVDGEWLDEVPRLAICRNLDESKFMVFHCDNDWNVLGVAAGYNAIDEAKAKVELCYHGLSAKWTPTGHSIDEARRQVAAQFKGQECAFCGRPPWQCDAMVCNTADTVHICNYCVDEYYDAIHAGRGAC
jgi:hypothetical protein